MKCLLQKNFSEYHWFCHNRYINIMSMHKRMQTFVVFKQITQQFIICYYTQNKH